MLGNLLSLIGDEGSLGFGEACLYALIGFCIIFVGIILIIFIIWLIGLVLRKTNNLEFLTKKRAKKSVSEPVTNELPTAQTAPDGASDEVSDQVKAAIVAALMAYYTEEKPECEFVVRRIKRI